MKRLKKWLPILCTALLLLGSSMTVFASTDTFVVNYDYSLDDYQNFSLSDEEIYYFLEQRGSAFYYAEDTDFNYLVLKQSDSLVIYVTDGLFYRDIDTDSLKIKDGNYYTQFIYKAYGDGKAIRVNGTNPSDGFEFGSDYFSGISFRSVVYNSDGTIFFRGPFLPALMAMDLVGTVQNQTIVITMIAVCCLALLIGSLVLVPRLRNWV